MWPDLNCTDKLDDTAFRKVILMLLLIFGMSLVAPESLFR